jgi:Protein of unknown function (DUF2815)
VANQIIADVDLVVRDVRIGFLAGYRPFHSEAYNKDSYSANVIFAPDHTFVETAGPNKGRTLKTVEVISGAIRQVANNKFGDRAEEVLEMLKELSKLPIQKGNVRRAGRPEYKDKLFLAASNAVTSRLVPEMKAYINGKPVDVTEDHPKAPYSGCIADVAVRFWGQAKGKKATTEGLFCNLLAVCWKKDDERLGGGSARASTVEFGNVDGASADEATPGSNSASSLL